MRYSLDTSSLINPWNGAYPPVVFPSLWDDHLPGLISAGELKATEEVRIELERQDDDLLSWARRQDGLFVPVDEPIQRLVETILADHEKLVNVNTSRSTADPFVIALAQANGCAVVTEEQRRPNSTTPRIPDVCDALGIRCISLIALIREQGWSYR